MAVDDIVGVRVVGRYQDQNIVNTMHYQITAQEDGEHDILRLLALAWAAAHTSAWVARHHIAYSLVGIRAFSLTGDNKVPGVAVVGTAGGVTGTNLPAMICRTVTLYTDSDNFRRRGRIMLSGSEAAQFDVVDGSVVSAEIALMEGLGDDLIEDVTSGANSFTPGLAPSGILPFEPFTAALGRKTPASVTSRRIRGFSIG